MLISPSQLSFMTPRQTVVPIQYDRKSFINLFISRGSTSAGFDVVLTGVGSCNVTLSPPEGEYFILQLY